MTAKRTVEELLEGRQSRRMKEEARFIDKLDRQMGEAEELIGVLMRDGKPVYYINVQNRDGRMTGKTKEFPIHIDAAQYLIRNRYV